MATSARLDELKKKFDENPRRYFAPLANEYRKLGDLTQAIALCRAHLPNQAGHVSGHIVLAQALYEARDLGESRQIFEAALDLDPENLIALRFLGDIAREQDEPWQARGWYERVLEADPRNEEIALMLRDLDAVSAGSAPTSIEQDAVVPPVASHEPPVYETPAVAAPPAFSWSPETARYDANAELGADVVGDTYDASDASDASDGQSAEPVSEAVTEPALDVLVKSPRASHVEFPEPDAILHDLPAGDASLSYFASTTSDEEYLSVTDAESEDPFFGAASSAGSLASGEVDAVVETREDDWFASPTRVLGAVPSPVADDQELDRFEDSFFSGAHETPVHARAVESASDPEAARLYFDEAPPLASAQMEEVETESVDGSPAAGHAASLFTRPTPSFLRAVPDAEGADVENGEFELLAPDIEVPEPFASPEQDDVHVVAVGNDGELDELDFSSFADDAGAESRAASSDAPDIEPVDDQAVAQIEAHTEAQTEAQTEAPIDAPRDEAVDEVEGADEADPRSLPPNEPIAAAAADGDFIVEYGEFVAPDGDDFAFIADPVSVPLDIDDAYGAGEIEASAPGLFALSADQGDAAAGESGAAGSESDVDPAVPPIEGLVTHDVEFEPVALAEDSASDAPSESDEAPAFVTETMAELYLQQGFHDEALAIYRQLLAQHPDDPALHDRVSALERGAASTVVDGIVPRDAIDRDGQSVRQFFAHFARREPRRRVDGDPDGTSPRGRAGLEFNAGGHGGTAGMAHPDEALTVPDHAPSSPSLTQLFSTGVVSGSDEDAATSLASAFGGHEHSPASRTAERELSLEHLFRDVPSRSSGAVTLDEFFHGASPGDAAPASSDSEDGEERGADIEQFTAWLEGLKKK